MEPGHSFTSPESWTPRDWQLPLNRAPTEAKGIVSKKPFACRNIPGKLIFACATCQLGIGCSVCLLDCFSNHLHEDHFDTLKGTCKHPRCTKLWGSVFCHALPFDALPAIPFPFLEEDPDLPHFPLIFQDELISSPCHGPQDLPLHDKTCHALLLCCHGMEELHPSCGCHQLNQSRVSLVCDLWEDCQVFLLGSHNT